MDGFTKLPKMQCFKKGGTVKVKKMCYGGKMKEGGKADLAQDKAVIKKAFKMHDAQEHEGEKTDLSKLRKGGRAKKDCGTVRKYKTGGSVTNVYEAKKSSGDLDNIQKTKDIKPGKAAAPSKAATKPAFFGSDVAKEKSKLSGHEDPYIKSKQSGKAAAAPSGAKGPDAYKKGGKVKKMADGGMAGQGAISDMERAAIQSAGQRAVNENERMRMMQRAKNAMQNLGPAQQSEFVNQGGMATAPSAPVNQSSSADFGTPSIESLKLMGQGMSTIPGRKKGGKVKRGSKK